MYVSHVWSSFRIIDPELAVNMLHKAPPKPPNFGMAQGPPPGVPPMVPGGPPFGGGGPMMGQPMHGPPPGAGMMPPAMPMRPGMAEGPPAQAPFASGPGGFGRPEHPPGPPPPPDVRRDPREERFGGRDPRNRDPRGGGGMGRDPRDPRGGGGPGGSGARPGGGAGLPPHLAGADPEKAQLIMQVLKLSDEQISMLPSDQRASILELKKQINSVPPQ